MIEPLEPRLLLSAYYHFDIIAATGQTDLAGNTISSIEPEISVNHSGDVALVANLTGAVTGPALMAGNATAAVRNIAFDVGIGRQYSFPQINDSDLVVARDTTVSASLIRTWDANASASNNIIVSTTDGDFDAVQLPTLANDGGVGFVALNLDAGSSLWFNTTGVRREEAFVMTLSGGAYRPMAANNDNIVVRSGFGEAQAIVLWEGATMTTIASIAGGWTSLGRSPGISENGEVVVWAGDQGNGPGVFASIREPGGGRTVVTIAGEADADGDGTVTETDSPSPDLGYTLAGMNIRNIYFSAINLDNRIGVTMYQNAATNNDKVDPGEKFLVTFMGTPSQASRDNPITGDPMLFSASEGIFTMHISADAPLSGAGLTDYGKTSAIPVIQVGDTLGGQVITALEMHDPIAAADVTPSGMARIVNPGDHYLAFFAQTASGSMVVRGTQLDSDNDGLFDHWEESGIDIDLDGVIDLNLPALGAQVMRKDIFMEIDWLRPDTLTGRNFAPQPAAIDFVVNMFANAPVMNPDGTMGITAHIDAGASLHRNMAPTGQTPSAASLQGGDQIGQAGTGNHIHVIYFGVDGSITFPGMTDPQGRPIVTRSVDNIKRNFFGTTSKWARELAFHYVLFADRHTDPGSGSTGIGEISTQATSDHGIPGNDFAVTLRGKRDPATLKVPPGGPPGSPTTIPTPAGYAQGQTLAHEVGHNLALAHGGVDSVSSSPPGWPDFNMANYKPTYRSLMNYAYQLDPDTSGALVRSYSGSGDAVYDDWSNIKLNFPLYFDTINNTFRITSRLGNEPGEIPEPNVEDFELVHGPAEDQPPILEIDSPAPGGMVAVGDDLIVTVTATDNVAVASVTIEFDVNGNGVIDPATERLNAAPIGNDQYRVTFNHIVGPGGARNLTATAYDDAEFDTPVTIALNLTGGFVLGDMNGDGALDAFDVAPFELALADRQAFTAQFPGVDPDLAGDIDTSGQLDAFDVAPFEALLAGGGAASIGAAAFDEAEHTPLEVKSESSGNLEALRRYLAATDFAPWRSAAKDKGRIPHIAAWRHIERLLEAGGIGGIAAMDRGAREFLSEDLLLRAG